MTNQFTLEMRRRMLQNGIIYRPAFKHYGEEFKLVYCESCKSVCSDCLGYLEYDLCFKCVNAASREIVNESQKSGFVDPNALKELMAKNGTLDIPLDIPLGDFHHNAYGATSTDQSKMNVRLFGVVEISSKCC
jgi:hypothetical protein